MAQQGSLELLNDPVAKALLGSVNPARLAYTWMDGSPRVVPIWFHWGGDQFVLATPPKAPKLKALAADPRVALTIDDNQWPYKVLLVRGRASMQMVDDVVPEYELAAARYSGPEQGAAWVSTLQGKHMALSRSHPAGWGTGLPDPVPQRPDAVGPAAAAPPPGWSLGAFAVGVTELAARRTRVAVRYLKLYPGRGPP